MLADTGGIKNIILDLGGVVADLDTRLTMKRFSDLGFPVLETPDLAKYTFFGDYEKGRIDTNEFLSEIQKVAGKDIPNEKIIWAWNTMVLDLKEDILLILKALKDRFRLYLLSNTNELHIRSFNERLYAQYGIKDLEKLFHRVYYSYKLGVCKPERQIFEFVLKDSRMIPAETLYIDDSRVHIESAAKLGIRGYHIEPPERLTELLKI